MIGVALEETVNERPISIDISGREADVQRSDEEGLLHLLCRAQHFPGKEKIEITLTFGENKLKLPPLTADSSNVMAMQTL